MTFLQKRLIVFFFYDHEGGYQKLVWISYENVCIELHGHDKEIDKEKCLKAVKRKKNYSLTREMSGVHA